MEKPFREYLERHLSEWMNDRYPEFSLRKAGNKEWVYFDWAPQKDFFASIGVRFVRGRDYVIPAVRWSRGKNFESFQEMTGSGLSPSQTLDRVNEIEGAEFSACEFGRLENYFPMEVEDPSDEYLTEKLGTDEAKQTLHEALIDNWRGDPSIRDWGMLIELLGEDSFGIEDIKYGLGEMPNEITMFIGDHFVPYVGSVWERIRQR